MTWKRIRPGYYETGSNPGDWVIYSYVAWQTNTTWWNVCRYDETGELVGVEFASTLRGAKLLAAAHARYLDELEEVPA